MNIEPDNLFVITGNTGTIARTCAATAVIFVLLSSHSPSSHFKTTIRSIFQIISCAASANPRIYVGFACCRDASSMWVVMT
eukprot:1180757-Prorocentrum_minimum.AAC.2